MGKGFGEPGEGRGDAREPWGAQVECHFVGFWLSERGEKLRGICTCFWILLADKDEK